MKKDEQVVQDLILRVDDNRSFLHYENSHEPSSRQSGVIASPEVLEDLRNALDKGIEQSSDILEKRLFYEELPPRQKMSCLIYSLTATAEALQLKP